MLSVTTQDVQSLKYKKRMLERIIVARYGLDSSIHIGINC